MSTVPPPLKPGSSATRFLRLQATPEAVDIEARTVTLAFSSEARVDRGWGVEILDHSAGAIRLDRLRHGGPLLMDHDTTDQVGVIEQVRIGADRVARADVRFGKSARASEVLQDVADGIRRNVSCAYVIHRVVLQSEDDGVATYLVEDWEPYEISIVSVPADTSVGVGRSAVPKRNEEPDMSEQTQPAAAAATPAAPAIAAAPANTDALTRAGGDAERKRSADILAIAEKYGKYNLGALAADAVRGGMPVDEFRAKAMDVVASAPKPTADIGMTDKEKRRYSFVRALNALANPSDRRAQEAAAFEFECASAAAQRGGKTPQGILVPYDVLTRDLTVGTPADGGYLVATNLQSQNFIDLLRNAMVLSSLGVTTLTGLVGNIAIPKQTGAGTAYWVTEGNAPTESKQAVGQVPLSPKTVGAYSDISRKLILQSSIDIERFVQADLAKVLGLAIQAAAIQGGGANEPVGILATVGIGDVAGGTDGAAPTWGNIIELETDVSVANADIGTLAYLTNAKVRGKLKATQKFNNTDGKPVWAEGNTPLNGYRAAVTNAVPSNLTKGAGTNLSAILFGNFADLIIGMWGGLDLTVDPYSNSTSGTVRVVALQDVDVAVRHAESFSAMKDAITA